MRRLADMPYAWQEAGRAVLASILIGSGLGALIAWLRRT